MKRLLSSMLLLLQFAKFASALKWNTIDTGSSGCHGSKYTPRMSYGARATEWGNVGRGGWRGAVLGPNGDKIYGIPTNASSVCGCPLLPASHLPSFFHVMHCCDQILEIDPMKRTMVTFGNIGQPERSEKDCAGTLHCGEEKWIGGVLAANGKIIGIPYAAETVLEIDPVARTASTFGVVCVLPSGLVALAFPSFRNPGM